MVSKIHAMFIMGSDNSAIIGFWFFVFISIIITIAGCSLYLCVYADDSSPKELWMLNDYILIGRLASVDTLEYLGAIEHFDEINDFYVLEYSFVPVNIIKGSIDSENIQLWYCYQIRKEDGYDNNLAISLSDELLIYGSQIESTDYLYRILKPGVAAELPSLDSVFLNLNPGERWNYWRDDSVVGTKIMESEVLRLHFKMKSPIIYCTEYLMHTFDGFRGNEITYCDKSGFIFHRDSKKEYIDKLHALTTEERR